MIVTVIKGVTAPRKRLRAWVNPQHVTHVEEYTGEGASLLWLTGESTALEIAESFDELVSAVAEKPSLGSLRKVREALRLLTHGEDPNGRLNGRLDAIDLLSGVINLERV